MCAQSEGNCARRERPSKARWKEPTSDLDRQDRRRSHDWQQPESHFYQLWPWMASSLTLISTCTKPRQKSSPYTFGQRGKRFKDQEQKSTRRFPSTGYGNGGPQASHASPVLPWPWPNSFMALLGQVSTRINNEQIPGFIRRNENWDPFD